MTKKTGYGLIAMVHLAKLANDQVASAREIADRYGIPAALLMNVLKELATAGYVESLRGARGGYRLALRPQDLTLADVITSLEGPIRQSECVTDEAGEDGECSCQTMARCPNIDPVHRVQRKINDFLKKVTLADILEPTASAAPGANP